VFTASADVRLVEMPETPSLCCITLVSLSRGYGVLVSVL
jgi:hypothetical protein